MLVWIIACHPITKVGGYMVTFGTVTAIRYTGLTLLYHAESAYARHFLPDTCTLGLFRRPDTPITQIMGQSI